MRRHRALAKRKMGKKIIRFRGELVENRIVVWSIDAAQKIFREGFYGKPLGIPKPKNYEFQVPLVLDLIEGYYLAKEKKLTIYSSTDGRRLGLNKMKKLCEEQYVDFKDKFQVYSELRRQGYVVAPGIKFGCDFAVYRHGPGIDHAPYLVQVMKTGDSITATGIVLAGRLATTVKKQFIMAVVDSSKGRVDFISFDWWRA